MNTESHILNEISPDPTNNSEHNQSKFEDSYQFETEECYTAESDEFHFDIDKLVENPKRICVYTNVNIRGRVFKTLLDSGATRSFCSTEVANLIKGWGFPVHENRMKISSPLGVQTITSEIVAMPICMHGKIAQVSAKVLPDSSTPIILGTDSLHLFGVLLNFEDLSYCLASDPTKAYKFADVIYEDLDDNFKAELNALFDLSPEQKKALEKIISENVGDKPEKLPATNVLKHVIDVGDHPPIKQPCYTIAYALQSYVQDQIDQKLADGIIEPSDSEWSSPIVVAKRPDGSLRMCQDFRRLNSVTKKNNHPIPAVDSILAKLRRSKVISTIDLSQAYHQVELEEHSRKYTAFRVPGRGIFQYKRMPFGLANAPGVFQGLIDKLFGPEFEPHVFAYLDDIIIVSETMEEHLYWLEKVLKILKEANLTINPEKCKFCRSEVTYLGYVLNSEGLQVDPAKIAPVQNYPAPQTPRQVRRFIGMASWYRQFIPNFASRCAPISKLLRKKQAWTWGPEQQKAFEDVKSCLTSAPTLIRPDFTKPFVLQTDASTIGLGAVLGQKDEEGKEHVIAYASRVLHGPEANYTISELECLAVIWAIEKFRCYLEGWKFSVITDHSCLRWLVTIKNPAGRLARWAMKLLVHDMEIIHRKGAGHHVPDALSRMYESVSDSLFALLEQPNVPENEWYAKRLSQVKESPKKYKDWLVREEKLFYRHRNPLVDHVTQDHSEWKYVPLEDEKSRILREAHDVGQAAHLGIEKTHNRILTRYFWPGLLKSVIDYVTKCDVCQRSKVSQRKPAGLMGERVIEQPWDVVAADIMGPLPRSKNGYSFLLVIQDLFTKWVELEPLRAATGPAIGKALNSLVVHRWGSPRVFVSDNGSEFINGAIDKFAAENKIHQSPIPPYDPQANPVERVNRVLKAMMIAYLDQDHREWDVHLNEFRFAYNTAYHTSIKLSPAFLNLGRIPSPVDSLWRSREGEVVIEQGDAESWSERMLRLQNLRGWVAENLRSAHDRQSRYYNRSKQVTVFKIGDRVLAKNRVLSNAAKHIASKLANKYKGPFTVTKVLSPLVYCLEDDKGKKLERIFIRDLKVYKS